MSNISSFRYVEDINNLTEKELDEHGYYIGFPCPHGHVIRDKKNIGVITVQEKFNLMFVDLI